MNKGDEVITALSMADGLGKKVDLIWNKLRKLDSILTETCLHNLHRSMASLEQSFAVMEKYVQNLKDKTGKTNTKAAVSPCPPECYFQRETKIEPDLRLFKYGLFLINGPAAL